MKKSLETSMDQQVSAADHQRGIGNLTLGEDRKREHRRCLSPGEMEQRPEACFRCGTCCIAPDISTLHKPVGVPCPHLREDHLCAIYPSRPLVCREYRPDAVCLLLQTLQPEQRVRTFLEIYDLLDEVAERE